MISMVCLAEFFEVAGPVLAEGTYIIFGEGLALVDIAAYRAAPALFVLLHFGLGLDILLVVGIGHGFFVAQLLAIGDGGDEEKTAVSSLVTTP